MRLTLFLITLFAAAGLFGPTAKEVAAQCTHLGGQGACPVGIPNGSTSVSFNANGTINWNTGGVSGPCCAAPSGTETGAGLLDLNNQLGGNGPGTGNLPTSDPNAYSIFRTDGLNVAGPGEPPYILYPEDCGAGGCTQGAGGEIFGANPNSGYLCDSGGPGCGNDLWTATPESGFGICGPGGCGGAAPIAPIDFSNVPRIGPYGQNLTTGDIDPFGGGSSFQDPLTGEAIDISDNPAEWPSHVKHADELNTAYVNGEIGYPFNDPDWRNKSVEDFENEPPPGPDNVSRPLEPYSIGNQAAVSEGQTPGERPESHTLQSGESLFRVALRYGVSVEQLMFVNGIAPGSSATAGQVLKIPAPPPAPGSSPRNPGEKYSDKTGRFGIGADTSLGTVGGLSARFQVAKNFGVQAIISFVRVDFDDKNPNADLTGYIGTVILGLRAQARPEDFVSVLPAVTPTPTPAPASTPADEDTEEPPEPSSDFTLLRSRGWNSSNEVQRVETEGQPTVYTVTSSGGRVLEFKSRDDAFLFSDRLNTEGSTKSYNQIVGELPADRGPINVDAANTDAVDTLTENVPKEFRAPKVNDIRIGEFVIRDPQTGGKIEVKSAQQRDAVLNAMRNGATLEQAAEIAQNAPVVTGDGLASATSSSTPGSTSSTPTRPEGTTAGNMTAVLNGEAYDIEVIKTPDGKVLAVGTGDNAGHVFGEVKETSNKLLGDFRREGPWTAPPAKTTGTATPATPQPLAWQPTPNQAGNELIRAQIANSDRDYMVQQQIAPEFVTQGSRTNF